MLLQKKHCHSAIPIVGLFHNNLYLLMKGYPHKGIDFLLILFLKNCSLIEKSLHFKLLPLCLLSKDQSRFNILSTLKFHSEITLKTEDPRQQRQNLESINVLAYYFPNDINHANPTVQTYTVSAKP